MGANKVLHVVQSAYRGTLEEQDDTVLWLAQALKGAGQEPAVLLRGNAVNYLVKDQDASGLTFGDKRQTQPPRLAQDVERIIGKGLAVHVVSQDLEERGIPADTLLTGATPVGRSSLPELFAAYEQVWYW